MTESVGAILRELRYAARSLGRDPALVAGVILTFALAIGANAAMFGLVTRLMLPVPPGVSEPSSVARLALKLRTEDGEQFSASTTSYPVFRALAGLGSAFERVAAVRTEDITIGQGADALEIRAIEATGDYFAVLGARPARGRFFTAEDDQLPSGTPVAVLSHAFWRKHFAARADVLGEEITLKGQPFTVIGVAAPGFSGDALSAVDVFIPLSAAMRTSDSGWSTEDFNLVSIIARVREAVSVPAASGQALAALRAVRDDNRVELTAVDLESLLPPVTRESTQARIALWLLGVSLIVLVIATANVGTLLLLRGIRRRRDVAIRVAMGAGQGRLALQLSAESVLLAITGGAAGLLVSHWLAEVVRVTLLPDLAPSDRFIDQRVAIVTLGMAVGAGIFAGLAPLALAASKHLAQELYGAGLLGTIARSRAQRALVGVQVALCTLLLVGAGLFVRSLQRVQSQELGFKTSRLLYVELDFREQLPGPARDAVHGDVVARLAGLRGVSKATIVQAMPFGHHHIPPISVPGMDEPPSAGGQLPILYGATPEYLDLMGVTLVQGRLLNAMDQRGSPMVALVNETMAREVWPNQSAIGKCFRAGHGDVLMPSPLAPESLPCREIVGVVRDSRARSLRPVGREATLMQYYLPFDQLPQRPMPNIPNVSGILLRTTGDAEAMAPVVQRFIQGNVTTPLYARVQQYQELLNPQMRPWRLGATLFSAFGVLALAIAAVGLFGVVSYLVTQRTREIGLRLALGGTTGTIGRSVVMSALRMVGLGLAAGIGGAVLMAPAAEPLLFETSARDPGVLVGAAVALLLVTIGAAAIPAWRASRVSPMTALHTSL